MRLIRLPLHLPPPPTKLDEVQLSDLVVNSELEGLPLGLVIGKFKKLGWFISYYRRGLW